MVDLLHGVHGQRGADGDGGHAGQRHGGQHGHASRRERLLNSTGLEAAHVERGDHGRGRVSGGGGVGGDVGLRLAHGQAGQARQRRRRLHAGHRRYAAQVCQCRIR